VGTHRAQGEAAFLRYNVRYRRDRELGAPGLREEGQLAGGLMDPEAQRKPDPAVEVLEPVEDPGRGVPTVDLVVVDPD
jgi:hypothetical protein